MTEVHCREVTNSTTLAGICRRISILQLSVAAFTAAIDLFMSKITYRKVLIIMHTILSLKWWPEVGVRIIHVRTWALKRP